jgi:F-type H+-transporting ATPase subunit delta
MHQDSKVARRYAKALLDFAIEKGKLEEVRADMRAIAKTCRDSRELVSFLKSPVVKVDDKVNVIERLFRGKIQNITGEFLTVVARKKRERVIPDIAHAFAELYREHHGILLAEITSAVPLTEAERTKARKFVGQLSSNVELKEKINPAIIGGFIIKVGDRQYDESIASRLTCLRTEFLKNPYISKF